MEKIEEMIAKAVEVAKNGTQEEQESFVEYICAAIRWCSYQGNSKDLEFFETAYHAYLEEKRAPNEEKSVQSLAEKSGKSVPAVYNLARKLGRLPTVEELKNQKIGRPKKYL